MPKVGIEIRYPPPPFCIYPTVLGYHPSDNACPIPFLGLLMATHYAPPAMGRWEQPPGVEFRRGTLNVERRQAVGQPEKFSNKYVYRKGVDWGGESPGKRHKPWDIRIVVGRRQAIIPDKDMAKETQDFKCDK